MSQDELALAVGASPSAVRRWEVGAARPSAAGAARLAALGMTGITERDTNSSSIPRNRDNIPRSTNDRSRRPFTFSDTVSELDPAPYVTNGPADQIGFHDTLLRLQTDPAVEPAIAPETYRHRLSLVAEVDGEPTSQALLERSPATATSWNSNYGSHGWHRYVGRFPPHVVRALLNHFQAGADDVVLDPFTGSGTTNVECRLLGVPSIGVEISPLSALIARTKSDFPESSDPLVQLASDLTEFYGERLSAFAIAHGGSMPDHAAVLRRRGNLVPGFRNYEKWLTPQALLGISVVIEYAAEVDQSMRDLLLVALSSKMRSIGNVDVDVVRAEYRKVARAKVDVLRLVRAQLGKMADAVDEMHRSHAELGPVEATQIIEGNILDMQFAPGSIGHVITSPPYGIESVSYLRTHLLSFRCLEPFLKTDPYEAGTGVIGSEYLSRPGEAVARYDHASVSETFNQFFEMAQRAEVPKMEQRRRLMLHFFDDMGLLINKMSEWIRPGGCVAFIIGNKRLGEDLIPAQQIVTELFGAHGFKLCDSIQHKLKTNNSNSQVPWQERIIQNEYLLILSKS